jgi:hypothetical protein
MFSVAISKRSNTARVSENTIAGEDKITNEEEIYYLLLSRGLIILSPYITFPSP